MNSCKAQVFHLVFCGWLLFWLQFERGSFSADVSISCLSSSNSGTGCVRVVPEHLETAKPNLRPAPFLCPSRRMLLDGFHCSPSVWLEKAPLPLVGFLCVTSLLVGARQEARGRQQRGARRVSAVRPGRVPQLVLSQQRPFLFADSLTQLGAALMSVGSWGWGADAS